MCSVPSIQSIAFHFHIFHNLVCEGISLFCCALLSRPNWITRRTCEWKSVRRYRFARTKAKSMRSSRHIVGVANTAAKCGKMGFLFRFMFDICRSENGVKRECSIKLGSNSIRQTVGRQRECVCRWIWKANLLGTAQWASASNTNGAHTIHWTVQKYPIVPTDQTNSRLREMFIREMFIRLNGRKEKQTHLSWHEATIIIPICN